MGALGEVKRIHARVQKSADGMVRPCSCPASKRSWQGAPKTRSTPCLRNSTAIAVIGIDIGKNSFHVVGHDKRGAIVLRQKWSRGQVETRLANLPPCLIGMEACVGAHHLSRKLKALGHDARLMPAKYVRPYTADRATVRQKKTGRPVRFELSEQTRQAVDDYLRATGKRPGEFLFTGRRGPDRIMTTRHMPGLYRTGSEVSGWTRGCLAHIRCDVQRRH